MDRNKIAGLLEAVRRGTIGVDEALDRLKLLPFEDLGYARVDHHRSLRRGVPEVVFAPGKTDEQILGIVEHMAGAGSRVLVSRATDAQARAITKRHPDAVHHAAARMVTLGTMPEPSGGLAVVVAAGTADLPVAEEAAITANFVGARVDRIYDVGVAGIHRLVPSLGLLESASVIIAVAGMEGALPSVVAGMVACPVIAVPTSIGYGTSFGGVAALLAMLNACASGIAVVNIDAGFSAGYVAALIARSAACGADTRRAHPPEQIPDAPGASDTAVLAGTSRSERGRKTEDDRPARSPRRNPVLGGGAGK